MRIDTGLAVKDNDTIGKVRGHDEIVLDDKGRLLRMHDEALDDATGHDTLLGIKVYAKVESASATSHRDGVLDTYRQKAHRSGKYQQAYPEPAQ
jgi:hypothetical protein